MIMLDKNMLDIGHQCAREVFYRGLGDHAVADQIMIEIKNMIYSMSENDACADRIKEDSKLLAEFGYLECYKRYVTYHKTVFAIAANFDVPVTPEHDDRAHDYYYDDYDLSQIAMDRDFRSRLAEQDRRLTEQERLSPTRSMVLTPASKYEYTPGYDFIDGCVYRAACWPRHNQVRTLGRHPIYRCAFGAALPPCTAFGHPSELALEAGQPRPNVAAQYTCRHGQASQ